MRAEIVRKGDEAVGSRAEVLAVDPYIAALVHAVELQQDAAPGVAAWKTKGFAVPSDTRGQVAAQAAAGFAFTEGLGDAPIMRQVECCPIAAGVGRRFGAGDIAAGKAPAVVKACDARG